MSYVEKMDFSCSIKALGNFQNMAKLGNFFEKFRNFFLYMRNIKTYQFAFKILHNWSFPAQKALVPKILGHPV